MDTALSFLIIIVGAASGFFLGAYLHKKQLTAAFEGAQSESKKILEDARREADQLIKQSLREGKEEAKNRRKLFEEEAKKRRADFTRLEQSIQSKEQNVDKKYQGLEQKEKDIETKEKRVQLEEKRYVKLLAEAEVALAKTQKTLEKVANMSADDAKKELMAAIENQARKEAQTTIRAIEAETRKEAEVRARSILSVAVQRLSGEYVNDSTISVVQLPSEEMKGRIIGREGRNIRAIEQATGVDLIIDDTPEAVIISCFNPIRREIAKITLERLIADGRIHPARIEEAADRVTTEFDLILKEHGEQAAFEVGITDLHPEVLIYLGKLKYRTSGLQSVLQHSVETAHLCGMLASEIGFNVKRAKRAGLLHDLGKAVDQEAEGNHALLGAELCEKYGEHQEILEAIRHHHQEELTNVGPLAVILVAANTVSMARPGARKEVLESYVKRLEDMEAIVKTFEGIEQTWVLQAGREVRVIVKPEGVSDEDVVDLANNIAFKLRTEVTFPGQIRVSVIKEAKFTEFAK
ncbi:MAG: ribonuclease Y [Pseudomonadota bacterium]